MRFTLRWLIGRYPLAMRSTRPLFEIDPGWLFVLAGLALCVMGVLIPAQRDLYELRSQHDVLAQRERLGNERLIAHARFLADLNEPDEALVRRLAASQLNLAPMGDRPVILAASESASLTEWIDTRVARPINMPKPLPDTTLSRLATGPKRLWLLGGGVLAVFVGLMIGPNRRITTNLSQSTLEHKETPIMFRALDIESAETADSVDLSCDLDFEEEPICEIVTRRKIAPYADQRCAAD